MKKILYLFIFLCIILVSSCKDSRSNKTKLVFGDLTWKSVQVHNRIATYILQNGIGDYDIEYTSADTLITINGIIQGDIDIDMESWHSNFKEVYKKGIDSGNLIDLGKNIPDAPQAWWVPRYLVEGKNALAPDLKSVSDLPKYWKLFKDPEDSSKGIIYIGTAGWSATAVSEKIFKKHNLGKKFNQGIPGSGAALAATMVGAYEKRKPWVGYYWAPTAILGRLDMVRLKGSEFPVADVNIVVNKRLLKDAPEVVNFLKKYSTSVADNNKFLAVMKKNKLDADATAIWFLKNKESVWKKWVSPGIAVKVKAALEKE